MDAAPRIAGLKDRPDLSPEQRRDEGLNGRQPARTDVVTLLRVRGAEPPIKTPRGRALSIGCRFAATDRQGPTTRRFYWWLHVAHPDQRRDIGPRGLSPVAVLVATLIRAMIGSVFQTCNSRHDAVRRRRWGVVTSRKPTIVMHAISRGRSTCKKRISPAF